MKQILIIFIILIMLTGATLFSFQYKKDVREVEKISQQFEEGLKLIREGKFNEGLERCETFNSDSVIICIETIKSITEGKKLPFLREYCERIPEKYYNKSPLTLRLFNLNTYARKQKEMNHEASTEKCYSYVSN